MNVNLKVLGVGALFFLGGNVVMAQKKDTATKTKDIEEVVVVGYQTKKKKEITTSVAQVNAKEMNNVPIATFDQILAGKAAGVDLQIGSGQPGASASVVIRGAGSINGSTTPLYIVDGVPVAAGAFATINPNDIENVSILKDAAAKAIYGSQAGAGVILVTTKAGRKGALKVEYTGSAGISVRPQAKFTMMNTYQLTQIQRDLGLITEATMNDRRLVNTSWDDVFLKTGYTMSNDLNVSGGSGNTTYFVSLGHMDQKGIALGSGLQRVTSNINLRSGNGKNFRFGFNGVFGSVKREMIFSEAGIALANPFAAAHLAMPYQSLYNADGTVATGSGRFGANAYELATTGSRARQELKATAALFSEYDINDKLTARVFGGVDYASYFLKSYTDPNSFNGKSTNPGNKGYVGRSFDQYASINTNVTLRYANDFGKHNLKAFVLGEYTGKNIDGFALTAYGVDGMIGNHLSGTQVNASNLPGISGSERRAHIISYLANADYSYDGKYFLSANVRTDGGSIFASDYKWGTFGGASIGWAINRENFLQGTLVSDLKLRASWGVLGNIGDLYSASLNVYNQQGYISTENQYNGQLVYTTVAPYNSEYRWEKEEQYNIGLDFGFWNNRLSGTVDFYNKDTKDLYISRSISRTSGFDRFSNFNGGEMRNRGVEASINVAVIRNANTKLNVNANFAYNANKITNLGEVSEYELGTSIVRVGLPLGSHYIVKWGGVDPTNGSPIYLDREGNRMSAYSAAESQATFGTYYAPYMGGFGLDFSHKGFYLSGQFQWKAKYFRFNNMRFFNEDVRKVGQYNQYDSVLNYWKEAGQVTDIQGAGYPLQFTSKFIEDSSFLRLRNVRIGYDFDKSLLEGTGLKGAGIFFNATNLFTWTKWTGLDPDDSNNLSSYEYPSPRIFTLGATLTF